jgi:Zn-dependent protease with chaperone function
VSEVAGLLHGPELPIAGVPARLRFEAGRLRVSRDDGLFEDVPVEALGVSVTGFNEDTLQLEWQREGHTHAVTVSDPEAHRRLLDSAPPSLVGHLRRGHSNMHWHRRKWNTVLGVLAGIALLLVVAWWQSEAITTWLAHRVSLETEIDIGEHALAQLELEHELTQEGAGAEALADIGKRLTRGSRYQYRWYVSAEREVNAFALPGGIVVVTAGMIETADNPGELAGVLAHEVQHIEQRHTLQQMIHTAGWAAVLAVVLGDVSSITAIVIHQLGNLRNSRKLESAADVGGMKALAQAGIPLEGMVSLFRKLDDEQRRRGGAGIALLNSHPATVDRIAELQELASTMKCDCRPLMMDWTRIQAVTREWRAAN